jgi:hypothetical protein
MEGREYKPFTDEMKGFICCKCNKTFHIGEKQYTQFAFFDKNKTYRMVNFCCDCVKDPQTEIANFEHFGCSVCCTHSTQFFHLIMINLSCNLYIASCSDVCYSVQLCIHNSEENIQIRNAS